MKCTIKKYLNARTASPSVEALSPYYKNPGDVLDIVEAVVGQEYEGSAVWYVANDGQYYWSEGFVETNFVLNYILFANLPSIQQIIVLKECCRVFFKDVKREIEGFNSVGISQNTSGNNCLSVSVQPGSSFSISNYNFKGFLIPVTVAIEDRAIAIGMGDSVSSESSSFGTAGFFFYDSFNQCYMVTNYHVLCKEYVSGRQYRFDAAKDGVVNVSLPSQSGNIIGQIYFGFLDYYNDFVVVKVKGNYKNSSPFLSFSNVDFMETIEANFAPNKYIGEKVGASSHYTSNTINHLNEHITADYDSAKHDLYDLIKLDKMTKPGDSGSALVWQNKLIGLVVAESNSYSYAIPVKSMIAEIEKKVGKINLKQP